MLVTPPVGVRPYKPWVTLFVDCFSRLIMGWAVSLYPNAATVLAGLRSALLVEEGKPFGGVPQVLVPDGGLEFATTALGRAYATLGDPAGADPALRTTSGRHRQSRLPPCSSATPRRGASLREIADGLELSHQRVHQIIDASGGTRGWKPRKRAAVDLACSFVGYPGKR